MDGTKCLHKNYNEEDAKIGGTRYIEMFSRECTEDCHRKIIKISQIVCKNLSNSVCWYFMMQRMYMFLITHIPVIFVDLIIKKNTKGCFDFTTQLDQYLNFPKYPNVLDEKSNKNNNN